MTLFNISKRSLLSICVAGSAVMMAGSGAQASSYPINAPKTQDWTFSGMFGSYDNAQLQRGFQVYREVCAGCHSMELLSFRNLGEPGGPEFSEEEVKAIAAEYDVVGGPDSEGEMFDRPAVPADRFPSPFPNVEAAAASNNNAYPPDFSLLAKARGVSRGFPTFIFDLFTQYQESGPDYIYSLLTGYEDAPEDAHGEELPEGTFYNPYFVGGMSLSMGPPLDEEIVDYAEEDIPETVDQYAKDVVAFMMWAAEPKLEQRKQLGFKVIIFLLIFAGLVYASKRRVWASVKH